MFIPVTDQVYLVSPEERGNFPNSFPYIDDEIPTLIDTLDRLVPGLQANLGDRPVERILNTISTGTIPVVTPVSCSRCYAHPVDIPAMVSKDTYKLLWF